MLPAFVGGLPGGMELAVAFLILVFLGFAAVVAVAAGRVALGGSRGDADEVGVEALERQVSDLRSRVDELQRRLDDSDQG